MLTHDRPKQCWFVLDGRHERDRGQRNRNVAANSAFAAVAITSLKAIVGFTVEPTSEG